MGKKGKKVFFISISSFAVIALVFIGMRIVRDMRKKPVPVYPVSELAQQDMGETMDFSGSVSTDRLQKIYLSETQTLTEIFVKEGDSVKAGDKLAAYDTSLKELDVKKAYITAEKTKLELSDAKKEMDRLQKATVTENLEGELKRLEQELEAAQSAVNSIKPSLPPLPRGSYTEDDPYYMEEPEADIEPEQVFEAAGSEDVYLAFVLVDGEEYSGYTGIHFFRNEDGQVLLNLFQPEELTAEQPSGQPEAENRIAEIQKELERVQELIAKAYPREELAQLQLEQKNKIAKLEIEVKAAELDHRQKEAEVGNGILTASKDGVVQSVKEKPEVGTAALVISSGGGYVITTEISEFERDTVKPGQPVRVTSWSSDMECEGTIQEIGSQPVQSEFLSEQNNRATNYPVKVLVDAQNDLKEDDYVSISYEKNDNESSWYLQNMFIRYDSGRAYVYVAGEDGRLEKRYISVGAELWGSMTEIKDGLAASDRIAFPYGTDLSDGALVQDAKVEELMKGSEEMIMNSGEGF